MSRKRKDSSQSTTLFDYFASSSKKTRRIPSKTSSRKPSSVVGGNIEEDVIIISSDVEPDTQEDSLSGRPAGMEAYVTPIHTAGKEVPVEVVQDDEEPIPEDKIEGFPELCDISNIPLEDHWDFKYDEAMEDPEEEVGDIATDTQSVCEAESRDESPESSCPICMTSLKGLADSETERHVNRCLDTSSAEAQTSRKIASSSNIKQLAKTAFSVLMSGYQDTKAWKEATEAENQRGGVTGRRSAPFYKVLQGMPIAVDAFRYGKIPGITAYFLSHAHSDHYTNLSSSWKNGLIYCSQTTANLVIQMLRVDPKWIKPLPLDIPVVIPDTGGVKVTLIQANHCPGSVLFLFEGRQTVNAGDSTFRSPHIGSSKGFRYLHCGDFRACPKHIEHDQIKGAHIDAVYLDTTYLDPRYCFPPQPLVISACADLVRRLISPGSTPTENGRGTLESIANWLVPGDDKGKEKERPNLSKERTLVAVGTYTIGKERIVKAIAKSLSTKVYCDSRKLSILKCIDDPELHQLLTNDPLNAGIHIVPLHMIVSDRLSGYLEKWNGHWTKIIGFRPTGWTYTSNGNNLDDSFPSIPHIISRDQARDFTHANLRLGKNSSSRVLLYNVPYSEHSSFFELTCFAMSLDWGKIIATVNVGSPRSRGKMEKWFEKWRAEKMKRLRDEGLEIVQYRSLDYW